MNYLGFATVVLKHSVDLNSPYHKQPPKNKKFPFLCPLHLPCTLKMTVVVPMKIRRSMLGMSHALMVVLPQAFVIQPTGITMCNGGAFFRTL